MAASGSTNDAAPAKRSCAMSVGNAQEAVGWLNLATGGFVRNSVIDPSKFAAVAANVCFSSCDAARSRGAQFAARAKDVILIRLLWAQTGHLTALVGQIARLSRWMAAMRRLRTLKSYTTAQTEL